MCTIYRTRHHGFNEHEAIPANKEPFLNQLARVILIHIIGTAPPVGVFMCIHVNTCVLPVVTSFVRVSHESCRTGTVSLVRVIT